MSHSPYKIDLPLRVALSIVLQGLRIRIGRSLVTVSGILLGVAILTSAATTHLIKEGVREEDHVRGEVNRMANFFAAELGSLDGRTVGIYDSENPTKVEESLVARITAETQRTVTISGPQDTTISEMDALLILGSKSQTDAFLRDFDGEKFRNPIAVEAYGNDEVEQRKSLYLVPLSADLTDQEKEQAILERKAARYRVGWILTVSLLVTLMGIMNAMLMSVTERFREIGTMKCLGATSRLVRRIFLIESLILGFSGSVCGAMLGMIFSMGFYSVIYGPTLVFSTINYPILCVSLVVSTVAGVLLTACSAIYPASVASAMVPAAALRSNV